MKAPVLCVLLALAASLPAQTREERKAAAERTATEEAVKELTEADQKRLEEQGIVIAGGEYRQIFSPYVFSQMPVLVTSDSILNGYHVLFEETVYALERRQAARLGPLLERMASRLEEVKMGGEVPAETARAGLRRARLVLGVARLLLGAKVSAAPDELTLMRIEADKVQQAEGFGIPAWLPASVPDFLGFDYSRFRPRGFYTRSERLSRYYRALSWLQAVPFRASDDGELTAMVALAATIEHREENDSREEARDRDFFRRYAAFIGGLDDWDLITASEEMQPSDSPEQWRQRLAERPRYSRFPQINDQLRFAPADPRAIAEPNFRIVSAYRLPDAVLFTKTTDPRALRRDGPSGLDLAAALGSDLARQQLEHDSPATAKIVREQAALFRPGVSLYHDYLHCLAALFDAPDAAAPPFLRTEAWQAKSLNTALAGWAQLRHTWSLQAKNSEFYAGVDDETAGFVEPNPEFFARLLKVVEQTTALLEREDALAMSPEELKEAIRAAIIFLRECEARSDKWAKWRAQHGQDKWPEEEEREEAAERKDAMEILGPLLPLLSQMKGGPKYYWNVFPADPDAVIGQLQKMLPALDEPATANLVSRGMLHGDRSLLSRWEKLRSLCEQLGALAGKQLRGADFTDDEQRFLREYGPELAYVMFYDGNSWEVPRDDAPRVVDVFTHDGTSPHAAVGRPRTIYVKYPWKGRGVICRGAVMPYYEFQNARRLTDPEWLEMVRAGKAPPLPAWGAAAFGALRLRPKSDE